MSFVRSFSSLFRFPSVCFSPFTSFLFSPFGNGASSEQDDHPAREWRSHHPISDIYTTYMTCLVITNGVATSMASHGGRHTWPATNPPPLPPAARVPAPCGARGTGSLFARLEPGGRRYQDNALILGGRKLGR
ncbi:hypothetical protein PVAP13_6NG211000 [Panicum virgatum]|uniref:Uncharacterized protein n=1 Tax=Panicum virgatum TaxID=38727 RepID=A0A8T0QZY8_PANVG|nr:hypothetical protein PVAP13_6NG211000 [Panicum virgatum]